MKKNKLVAMFGIKYDEALVPGLMTNLSAWVDDFAVVDDRRKKELWGHEGEYRKELRKIAFDLKADWVLITSPDERWEINAGATIRNLIDYNNDKIIYEFKLRELFTPYQYRVDGIWGNKVRRRLYPLRKDQTIAYKKIQCPSFPQDPDYNVVPVDINIYHLKMIERENRIMRARVFNATDPNSEYQDIGYDYLADEDGMELKFIDEGREYEPPYERWYFNVPKQRWI